MCPVQSTHWAGLDMGSGAATDLCKPKKQCRRCLMLRKLGDAGSVMKERCFEAAVHTLHS